MTQYTVFGIQFRMERFLTQLLMDSRHGLNRISMSLLLHDMGIIQYSVQWIIRSICVFSYQSFKNSHNIYDKQMRIHCVLFGIACLLSKLSVKKIPLHSTESPQLLWSWVSLAHLIDILLPPPPAHCTPGKRQWC